MNTYARSCLTLATVGLIGFLGTAAQAGGIPACTEATADLETDQLSIYGNFRYCSRPAVLLGQADGRYAPLVLVTKTTGQLLAQLTEAVVAVGTTQKVVVKCSGLPYCALDVAMQEACDGTGECSGAPVAKTGQTTSYSDIGGDDGDLEKGVAWPDPRFTNNGDGTVTDNLTGLIWLKDANCFGPLLWADAVAKANALYDGCDDCGGTDSDCGLNDSSTPGAWRLPNIKELLSLVDYGQVSPSLPSGHPFSNVQEDYYWSSTTYADDTTNYAWNLILKHDANMPQGNKTTGSEYVWPVRGGQ